LRYHDAKNWPLLRTALKDMGRADLIGNGKQHLVPSFQPKGTNTATLNKAQVFKTKFTGLDNNRATTGHKTYGTNRSKSNNK